MSAAARPVRPVDGLDVELARVGAQVARLRACCRALLTAAALAAAVAGLLWAFAAGQSRADRWCRAHIDTARAASTCQGVK